MSKRILAAAVCGAAAMLGATMAEAKCRTGPPPQEWVTDDSGSPLSFDLSPITKDPVLGALGKGIAEATRGVTNIRHIMNLTECPVSIRKVDGAGRESKSVGPRGTLETNFWIPWADDARTQADHHMIISIDGKDMFWLWQDKHVVRFKAGRGYTGAQNAPGIWEGGGDRMLAIAMGRDNKPVFMFARR